MATSPQLPRLGTYEVSIVASVLDGHPQTRLKCLLITYVDMLNLYGAVVVRADVSGAVGVFAAPRHALSASGGKKAKRHLSPERATMMTHTCAFGNASWVKFCFLAPPSSRPFPPLPAPFRRVTMTSSALSWHNGSLRVFPASHQNLAGQMELS